MYMLVTKEIKCLFLKKEMCKTKPNSIVNTRQGKMLMANMFVLGCEYLKQCPRDTVTSSSVLKDRNLLHFWTFIS